LKKSQEKNPPTKVLILLPNVCYFLKENQCLEYGFKNLYKIYSLAYWLLFFVISISGNWKVSLLTFFGCEEGEKTTGFAPAKPVPGLHQALVLRVLYQACAEQDVTSWFLACTCARRGTCYTAKKVSDFPVPSRDVTNKTLSGGV
jgi:hypothetical protein